MRAVELAGETVCVPEEVGTSECGTLAGEKRTERLAIDKAGGQSCRGLDNS